MRRGKKTLYLAREARRLMREALPLTTLICQLNRYLHKPTTRNGAIIDTYMSPPLRITYILYIYIYIYIRSLCMPSSTGPRELQGKRSAETHAQLHGHTKVRFSHGRFLGGEKIEREPVIQYMGGCRCALFLVVHSLNG